MNSQKSEMVIATSSSIAIIPETRQMNLNLGRFSVSWGSSFIPMYAMPWTIVAMMKNKTIAKCVSSGETPITRKCKPIKAVRNEVRKRRSPWNASKKTSASSLTHTQIRILELLRQWKNPQNQLYFNNKKRKSLQLY